MPLTLTTSFGFSLPVDSCSFVRVIVLDISSATKHFEKIDSLDTVLDEGGVRIAPILNVILGYHESHGFEPSKMGASEQLIQAVFDHLLYEYPALIEEAPFDITDWVKKEIEGICEVFSLCLHGCALKGRGWSVIGYRSSYHPIIGKVLE